METMTVAGFLTQQIALSGRSQKAVATDCGYANANIITMFKKGRTKLPLNKVAAMAGALNADPQYMLRLVMTEYDPEAWAVVVQIMGAGVTVTEDELRLLDLVRAAGRGRAPCLDVVENSVELTAAVERAVERDDARDSATVTRRDAEARNALRA
jgi:hypothetical protein